MDKNYVDGLCNKFPSLSRNEIEQACLLAELRVGEQNTRLAWRMVQCACLNRLRREAMLQAKFPSYDVDDFPEALLKERVSEMELLLRDQEWDDVVSKLPRRAKKLAQIAQDETAHLVRLNPHVDVWTRQTLSILREKIKARFVEWEWNHSTAGYFKARRQLVEAFNRNRRKER